MGATLVYMYLRKWRMVFFDHCITGGRSISHPMERSWCDTNLQERMYRFFPTNYRPLSLTSIVCKTLESIIKDRIITHFANKNLFYNMSAWILTWTFLCHSAAKCDGRLDWGYEIRWVSWCDVLRLQENFDRGPHNELISKLKSGAVLEISLSSFQSFCLLRTCTVDLRAEFPVTLQY